MNLPPALTWMHLLPSGTSLDCRQAPDWFRGLASARDASAANGARPPRAVVSFDADAAALLADAAGADGVVGVNAKGLSAASFAAAGFPYARRFAVLPNLAAARWFIPLDSGPVAAAGFAVYSPSRWSARIKVAAAKLAARVGLSFWYQDEVWVAAREQPTIERLVSDHVPGGEHRLALSAGAPEPARNRKASFAVLGIDGSVRAFVKLPSSALAQRLVRQEAAALAGLGSQFPGRDAPVPRLLYAGERDGQYALVQAPITGSPTTAALTPEHRTLLGRLQVPDDRKRATETRFFKDLTAKLERIGLVGRDLRDTLTALTPTLANTVVPRTIVHGDFAPWNVRRTPGADCVAAFDWEYGELDGLPLMDETHFDVQVRFQLHEWPPERMVGELEARAGNRSDLSPAAARALQAVYLIDSIARLLDEGYPASDDMIVWYRKLLDLGPGSARHWGGMTA